MICVAVMFTADGRGFGVDEKKVESWLPIVKKKRILGQLEKFERVGERKVGSVGGLFLTGFYFYF